jgi:uncharacterized membrane protein
MERSRVPDGIAVFVEASTPAAADVRRIELLPACSLTPRAARLFFCSVAVTSLTIAMAFVISGYWPVLPFAGVELVVLGWALCVSLRRRHYSQTVEIGDAEVTITTCDQRGDRRMLFSRHWARVTLRGPDGWQPSRLLIESHGRACEVGGFLTDAERRAVWQRLRTLIGRASESPPLCASPGALHGGGRR